MEMNGPQLKAVLERAYRNYYYYKYVPGYGGYSYYTTCMIDINAGGFIGYTDTYPELPNGNNVGALVFDGKLVDFSDADTYYRVSTVNYLAAGSCNFNDGGVSLWPLDQIVNDTQFYVRDAVIDYVSAMGTVSPAIEGRLGFYKGSGAPTITINSPMAQEYPHPSYLTLDFSAIDDTAVKDIWANLDGVPVSAGQVIDLHTLALGEHTLAVVAVDEFANWALQSVTFKVVATAQSLEDSVKRLYAEGMISKPDVYNSLLFKLDSIQMAIGRGQVKSAINQLQAFINLVKAQKGKAITADAANLLITDAQWVIKNLR
jgi:hypothetical protein